MLQHSLSPGDRSRAPAATLDTVRPHWGALGITRLARQTGLDRIGIPVWAAMRPNATTLAVNQGKGIDDNTAQASAVMEAVEYAIGEAPEGVIRRASLHELRGEGAAVFDAVRLLPQDRPIADDQTIDWIEGEDLLPGHPVWMPLDAVRLDHTRSGVNDIGRSSNGRASGNTYEEALLPALLELIERDADTLFAFRSDAEAVAAAIDPADFADPVVDALAGQIAGAGLRLGLFDRTSDLDIPVISAVIAEAGPPRLDFDLAGGTSCHPVAARAAVRAITEAAQTRITHISGARDDFDPSDYEAPFDPDLTVYLDAVPSRSTCRAIACGLRAGASLEEMLAHVTGRLRRAGAKSLPVVHLGGAGFGVAVVKAFSALLEDKPANRHWRPGPRALNTMLRLW